MAAAPLILRSPLLVVPAGMLALWGIVVSAGHGRLDALGNPLGGDFAMFYQAGQSACRGDWDQLYNEAEQQKQLVANFPELPADTYLPYRYPPLTAIVLAPLGTLPYPAAWLAFLAAASLTWIYSWHCLVAGQTNLKTAQARIILAGLVFSPIMAQSIIDGQASLFWFAIAVGAHVHLQRGRWALAGAILALGALKPNVMALLAVVWIVRYPQLLIGLIPMSLAMLATTIAIAGWDCLTAYACLARELATGLWPVETPYWKVQSLLSWTQLIAGPEARQINLWLGLLLAIAVGARGWLSARRARHQGAEDKGLADTWLLCAALLINALFNPYTPVYDLTLLSLGMFAAVQHAANFGYLADLAARRDVQLVWLCLWLGPIVSQNLASALHSPTQVMPLWLLMVAAYAALTHPARRFALANPR